MTQSQVQWTIRDIMDAANTLGTLQQFEGFTTGARSRPAERPIRLASACDNLHWRRRSKRLPAREPPVNVGAVARAIVQYLARHRGMLTAEDFQAQQAEWVEPLHTTYRGYDAYGLPPNSQGLAALQLLNGRLERFKWRPGRGEPRLLSCADRSHQTGVCQPRPLDRLDPDFQPVPLARLLSPTYAQQRASLIDMQCASPYYTAGGMPGDTVYIAVVDAAGNAVSMLQSLYFDFGSGIVAGDTEYSCRIVAVSSRSTRNR